MILIIFFKFQEKTREQREGELIPKVTEAISLGVNVIEAAFEKLDTNIDNSDSEDEEDTSYRVDPIFEAKVWTKLQKKGVPDTLYLLLAHFR